MIALIDGDIILYSCGFVAEKKTYSVYTEQDGEVIERVFDERKEALAFAEEKKGEMQVTTNVLPVSYSLHAINQLIERIMNTTGAKESRVFLTGKDNFRDSLVDYYKKNRDPEQKPVHYKECKAFLIRKYRAEVIDGMEADDALGINQTHSTIICTIDKDLDMIPGWHYNWQKDTRYFVSEQGAIEWFYTQLLTGDNTDNIPGLFQTVGIKASAKIKEGIKGKSELEMWNYVSKLYTDGGASIDKVVEIARLLWIHRDKTVPLWEPPSEQSANDIGLASGT